MDMDGTNTPTLNEIERRVLGVLLEKALAQPQYYPMTVNAIVAACNQKSNRDPVLQLDEEAIWNTLERMRAAGLISRLLPGGASRVERFKHEAKDQLGWEKPQRAIMAELLLRGPQTVGELRTRCQRMYPFENIDAVAAVLEGLSQGEPSWVRTLPRAPGHSAVRHAHRLYEPDERKHPGDAPDEACSGPSSNHVQTAVAEDENRDVRQELDNLQEEVAELHESVAGLRRRLELLEQRTG